MRAGPPRLLGGLFGRGHGCWRSRQTIKEFPITYHEREGDATLESFRDGWRHVRFMLLNAPGYLFSIPGALMGFLGLFVMGLVFFDTTIGSMSFGTHTMIAGSLLTLVGYQAASTGIFATIASDPIQRPNDPLTETIVANLNLERTTTIGLLLIVAGGTYATWLVARWAASGFTILPMVVGDVVAFTAIVSGVQTVFSAFFMSAIGSQY